METKQITYGIEDLVSRIPGLFPYFEFGENGVTTIHSATDSINGCYGHIPCGIHLPSDVGMWYDGVRLLNDGGSYSYRTLISLYYEHRDRLPAGDPFIVFMERCIGRFRIWNDMYNQDWDLVPEFGYYGECSRLYSEYSTISVMCEIYQQMKSSMNEVNCEMECLVETYARMGGDDMRDYYLLKSQEAVNIANLLLEENSDIDAATIDIGISLVSTEHDLGILSTYLDYWEPGRRYVGGDMVIYNDRTYLCICQDGDYTEGVWDPDTETIVFDQQNFTMLTSSDYTHGVGQTWTVSGTMESILPVFKETVSYTDEGGNVREPEAGEDWLWFYKIGSIGNYETSTDEYGNINIKEGSVRMVSIGSEETNLMAYGDVLTDITCDLHDLSVTFTYVIGANLKAVLTDIVTDDNGVVRYYYGRYSYNSGDSHGVICTETYQFCGDTSEIESIIINNGFNTYVTSRTLDYQYSRCPFSTYGSSGITSMTVNGIPISSRVRMTDFIVSVENEKDILVSPVTKHDYLVGITMNPYVDADVFVNRGDSAAWERHVKLGDVKTMEDLQDYANGGFFNIM